MATDVYKYKQHTLHNLWAKEEIREIRKYFGLTNETATFHNSWDAVKAVLRSKFTFLNAI